MGDESNDILTTLLQGIDKEKQCSHVRRTGTEFGSYHEDCNIEKCSHCDKDNRRCDCIRCSGWHFIKILNELRKNAATIKIDNPQLSLKLFKITNHHLNEWVGLEAVGLATDDLTEKSRHHPRFKALQTMDAEISSLEPGFLVGMFTCGRAEPPLPNNFIQEAVKRAVRTVVKREQVSSEAMMQASELVTAVESFLDTRTRDAVTQLGSKEERNLRSVVARARAEAGAAAGEAEAGGAAGGAAEAA